MDDVKVEAGGLGCRSEGTLGCGVVIVTFGVDMLPLILIIYRMGFKWAEKVPGVTSFENPRRGHTQLI